MTLLIIVYATDMFYDKFYVVLSILKKIQPKGSVDIKFGISIHVTKHWKSNNGHVDGIYIKI